MDKTITLDQLATADLRSITEIWLDGAVLDGSTPTELCLWRGEQVFTHDMLSEGTHDQNARRLRLQIDNIKDQNQLANIEVHVRDRLSSQGMNGNFFPAERSETYQTTPRSLD